MATITARLRKDGSIGYTAQIRITREGKPIHQESKTLSSRAAAGRWATFREAELEDPTAFVRAAAKGTRLRDLIRWYLNEFQAIGKWGRTKQTTLEFLERHKIGEADALLLTVPILVDHIRARRAQGTGPATAGNDLTWIRCVLRAARSVKGLPVKPQLVEEARNACRELRLIRRSGQRDRTPTYEELEALDRHFEQSERRGYETIPMRQIIWFAIYSTRREEEITLLRRSDNESDRKLGMVRDAKHPTDKDGNHRTFRYTPEAWAIMESQPIQQDEDRIFPYNCKTIGERFRRACRLLEIENLHFHDLRHEGTTRLFEQGLAIPEVAAHTLHTSWSVLQRYTHLTKRGRLFNAPFLTVSSRSSDRSTQRRKSRANGSGPASGEDQPETPRHA
jgi:integrase